MCAGPSSTGRFQTMALGEGNRCIMPRCRDRGRAPPRPGALSEDATAVGSARGPPLLPTRRCQVRHAPCQHSRARAECHPISSLPVTGVVSQLSKQCTRCAFASLRHHVLLSMQRPRAQAYPTPYFRAPSPTTAPPPPYARSGGCLHVRMVLRQIQGYALVAATGSRR